MNGPRVAFRFELAADGNFAGHLDLGGASCVGTLTTEEAARLVAAVNGAAAMCRASNACPSAHDFSYYDVEITNGASATNAFCYSGCLPPDDPIWELLQAARAPLQRAALAGACVGPEYPILVSTPRCAAL